jgi:hypothetical protein
MQWPWIAATVGQRSSASRWKRLLAAADRVGDRAFLVEGLEFLDVRAGDEAGRLGRADDQALGRVEGEALEDRVQFEQHSCESVFTLCPARSKLSTTMPSAAVSARQCEKRRPSRPASMATIREGGFGEYGAVYHPGGI